MSFEREGNRWLGSSDECPYCDGIGKLNERGAPDCPHCKGTGVMESFPNDYPKDEAKICGKSQNF